MCVRLISNMKISMNFPTRDLDLKKNQILAYSLLLRRGISQEFEDCLIFGPLRGSYVIGLLYPELSFVGNFLCYVSCNRCTFVNFCCDF